MEEKKTFHFSNVPLNYYFRKGDKRFIKLSVESFWEVNENGELILELQIPEKNFSVDIIEQLNDDKKYVWTDAISSIKKDDLVYSTFSVVVDSKRCCNLCYRSNLELLLATDGDYEGAICKDCIDASFNNFYNPQKDKVA